MHSASSNYYLEPGNAAVIPSSLFCGEGSGRAVRMPRVTLRSKRLARSARILIVETDLLLGYRSSDSSLTPFNQAVRTLGSSKSMLGWRSVTRRDA
jgi:hypothetical protein